MDLTGHEQNFEGRYNRRFKMGSILARFRGWLVERVSRTIETDGRPLLLGSNVDVMNHGSGKILLRTTERNDSKAVDYNPTYPSASSIGYGPHWKFLDPPSYPKTKLRLQAGSRLIMCENSMIAKGSYISIWPEQELYIGANCYIGHNAYLNTKLGFRIGDNATIGHNVTIMDYDGHPLFRNGVMLGETRYGGNAAPIEIGNKVWIGFHATILKGVKIGDGAVVGARAVVRSDVPANSVVLGDPAVVVSENVSWSQF